MYSINEFFALLDGIAPLSLSKKMIEKGCYDNSGIIVKSTQNVCKVAFTLDLSENALLSAIENGCDTIVTHHPAIYTPVKSLEIDGATRPLIKAVQKGINVISMHLNLDIASSGIDQCLAIGLGATSVEILEKITDTKGYGRLFTIKKTNTDEFFNNVKQKFQTDKALKYGNQTVEKIASFCGAGADSALKALLSKTVDFDTVVTADIPHHVLKELIEKGKNVIVLSHYASEQYGFNEFYKLVTNLVGDKVETFNFLDERFM